MIRQTLHITVGCDGCPDGLTGDPDDLTGVPVLFTDRRAALGALALALDTGGWVRMFDGRLLCAGCAARRTCADRGHDYAARRVADVRLRPLPARPTRPLRPIRPGVTDAGCGGGCVGAATTSTNTTSHDDPPDDARTTRPMRCGSSPAATSAKTSPPGWFSPHTPRSARSPASTRPAGRP